ncbi:hypothetical protein TWF679_007539 [Orbilia oligospora]|uniref:Uncharacterized protein n=1 Tax=Orbilia oligospora TaxID=2813651 RepID=A0A8H8V7A8_ORBOL|nr:hypothetical protein TWF679_007539 [Orbilia oligospora]
MEYGEGSFPTYLWNPGSGSINLKVDNFEASIINLPLNSVMRSELIPGKAAGGGIKYTIV